MRRRAIAPLAVCLIAALGSALLAAAPAAASTDCHDYEILGARGTTAPYNADTDFMGPVNDDAALDLKKILIAAGHDDVKLDGVWYPATVYPSGPDTAFYFDSIDQGVVEAKKMLADIRRECGTQTKVILTGYSQGADVMSRVVASLPASTREIVVGEMMFGDPGFDPDDKPSDYGKYNPDRAGLLTAHPHWNAESSAPAVSSCRRFDGYCQGMSVIRTFFGNFRLRGVAQKEIFDHNSDYNYEHEKYVSSGDAKKTACELAKRLGFPACGRKSVAPALDVALLVDTTAAAAPEVSELQDRASDLIDLVSKNVGNARFAVLGYGEGSVDDATNGFVTDPVDAVDAIRNLSVVGGQYGSIYSAINHANNLDWRPGVKKVTLTLSASRACPQQICNTEYGTSVAFNYLLAGDDARRAGVYTRDNDWFFDGPGWPSAIDSGWASRPGSNQAASVYINELFRVFRDALVTPDADVAQGTTDAVPGMSGHFSAANVVPYFSDSPAARYVWSIQRTGDTGPRPTVGDNSGGPAASVASRSTPTARLSSPPDENEGPPTDGDPGDQPELPADMGPTFDTEFTQSGAYTVRLDVYLDGQENTYQVPVKVWDLPSQGPAAPWLTSNVEGNEQVLRWTAGDGVQALAYGVTDQTGAIVEAVGTDTTTFSNGHATYEQRMPLVDGKAIYSLVSFNEVGKTAALPLITADKAQYTHISTDAGVPTGGVLELSGPSTPELEAALQSVSEIDGAASLAGDYIAHLVSPNGDDFALKMDTVQASIATGDRWTMQVTVRGAQTTDGRDLGGLMDDGLADEILANGHIDFQVGDEPVRAVVSPAAAAVQLDQYIIDSNSPPPAGTRATVVSASQSDRTLTLANSDTPEDLAFISEASDPLRDWSAAVVSDVHTWIGNAEVENSLTNGAISTQGDTAITSAGVSFAGDVVGGTPNLMRDFLTNGTISFRVDNGSPTVLLLRASSDDAHTMAPDMQAPALVGRSTVAVSQYSNASWGAVVNWGTSTANNRAVYLDGSLPNGLYWNPWSGTLSGTPTAQGTYSVTLTAIGNSGQSTRAYSIVVGPSSASSFIVEGNLNSWTDEDNVGHVGIFATGYFRPDNPAYATTLPAVAQYPVDGYLYGPVTDVQIVDANGQPLPIVGDFTIDLEPVWGMDQLYIYSDNLTVTDPTAPSLSDLLAGGGRIEFRYQLGGVNTVGFGAAK